MTDREWVAAYACALGVAAPSEEQFEQLLFLAAEAAHSSQRTAAPIACWLAARSDLPLESAIEVAETLRPTQDA
jgi:hypothetical protein